LVGANRGAIAAFLLGGARAVHLVERIAAFGSRQTGKGAAFDPPAGFLRPDQIRSRGVGKKSENGNQKGEDCQGAAGWSGTHSKKSYQRISALP